MVEDHSQIAIAAARLAGNAILKFYGCNIEVKNKGDGSPLTLADMAAHGVIADALHHTGIPVVSEECDDLQMDAKLYWLVDPLDGTKDFLASNNEFTVNIALVQEGSPLLGVVYAPALNEMYVGGVGLPGWFQRADECKALFSGERSVDLRMAVSRFHDHPDGEEFSRMNDVKERVALGSALKYGRLALGEVDVFPRLVGSSEWDTAAGQAILEAAGGQVLDWHTGRALRYGKARRRNPRLLALRAPYLFKDFKLKFYEVEIQ